MSEQGYQAASLTYHKVMNVHMTGKNHSGGSLQIKPLKHANNKKNGAKLSVYRKFIDSRHLSYHGIYSQMMIS